VSELADSHFRSMPLTLVPRYRSK